ncbi:MAG: hydrogenase maturation nickel metallochaperone HypA [Jatrophihabitantaceae bacterium]
MHELTIAESIVEAVRARIGERRVSQVRLQIGQLSGVSVDSLRFCFDLAVLGTTLDGARLDIEERAGRARCAGCEQDFGVSDLILLCPCGSADVRILEGDELRIMSVEVAC